jgi:outer membrane protein assembly factor BamB
MKLFATTVLVVLAATLGCGRSKEASGPSTPPAQDDAKAPASPQRKAVVPGRPFGWRLDGTGRFLDVDATIRWSIDEKLGIGWQTEVGDGLSSPVVAGDRVFLTAEQDQLICVDRKQGEVLWRKDNGFATLPPEMEVQKDLGPSSCGFATPTPITDGKFIYASYGTGIVVCYDLDGERRWVRYFDLPLVTEYGRSASPVLAGGRLVISISRLIALDPTTGKTIWDAKEAGATYGTPAVAKICGVDVLVTPIGHCVRVSDGEILAEGIGGTLYNSPIVRDDVVFFVSTTASAVRLSKNADGKIKAEQRWETDLEGEFFSSPVWHDGIVYVVGNEGVLFALDEKTGKIVWQKELPIPSQGGMGPGEPANIYASLAIAGKHLYVANDIGNVLVVTPGQEYKEVAQNELDDGSGASPVFDGKQLFLRGGNKLYRIDK